MEILRKKQELQELLARLSELGKGLESDDIENLLSEVQQEFDDVFNQLNQLQKRFNSIQESQLDNIDRLLAFISFHLRQAISAEEMLEDAANEVCHLLQVEHTFIHHFGVEWKASIGSESAIEPKRSLLGKPIPSIYFELNWLHCYERGIARVVEDSQSELLSPSAIESFAELGVKSSIAVAIPMGFRLAGLLIVHQYESTRQWHEWEISFLEQLATQLAIHLHQLSLLEKAQTAISQHKQIEKQLFHNTRHDLLTGLPNRVLLMERLQYACDREQAFPKNLFALLFLDFDRFKAINDSLGHLIGDQLLIAISERLQMCLRTSDTLARLGGDEFVILLDNIATPETSTHIAERILQALKVPFIIDNVEIDTSASIGIAVSNGNYTNPTEMLRDADVAMYCAKEGGKAKYIVFDTSMSNLRLIQLEMEHDLRRAIEQKQFLLHYQPIVSPINNMPIGFEALLRWYRPSYGFVPPMEFIPIAEESNIIIEIGHWVLQEACRQIKIWQDQFPCFANLTMSVNVSGIQIMQSNFVSQIEEILESIGLNPTNLKIEITETVFIKNIEACRSQLEALHGLGIQVHIDDFGTGYSSFGYLQNFPVDVLKIDRSFIQSITSDYKSLKIVQAIVELAHNMGIRVIAEGVETSEQLAHLNEAGTSFIQGYLISRPLESDAISHWLQELKEVKNV